jgi:hypothetical protein
LRPFCEKCTIEPCPNLRRIPQPPSGDLARAQNFQPVGAVENGNLAKLAQQGAIYDLARQGALGGRALG